MKVIFKLNEMNELCDQHWVDLSGKGLCYVSKWFFLTKIKRWLKVHFISLGNGKI